jgi:hypothetical protein
VKWLTKWITQSEDERLYDDDGIERIGLIFPKIETTGTEDEYILTILVSHNGVEVTEKYKIIALEY